MAIMQEQRIDMLIKEIEIYIKKNKNKEAKDIALGVIKRVYDDLLIEFPIQEKLSK